MVAAEEREDEDRQREAEGTAKGMDDDADDYGGGDMGDTEMDADLNDDIGLDPEGNPESLPDEEPRPHGHGALHDLHDFYTAGQSAIDGHLKMADNDELKSLMGDHRDQMEAMSQEVRDLCQKNYPEHPQPEPYQADAMKSGEAGDEPEGAQEEEPAEDDLPEGEPQDVVEGEDESTREKSRTNKGTTRKAAKGKGGKAGTATTKKSRTADDDDADDGDMVPAADYRALQRKFERYRATAEATLGISSN